MSARMPCYFTMLNVRIIKVWRASVARPFMNPCAHLSDMAGLLGANCWTPRAGGSWRQPPKKLGLLGSAMCTAAAAASPCNPTNRSNQITVYIGICEKVTTGALLYIVVFSYKNLKMPSFLSLQPPALQSWKQSHRLMVGSYLPANSLDLSYTVATYVSTSCLDFGSARTHCTWVLRAKQTSMSSASTMELVSSEFCSDGKHSNKQPDSKLQYEPSRKLLIWLWFKISNPAFCHLAVLIWLQRPTGAVMPSSCSCQSGKTQHPEENALGRACLERELRGGVRTTDRASRSFSPQVEFLYCSRRTTHSQTILQ